MVLGKKSRSGKKEILGRTLKKGKKGITSWKESFA